MAISQRISFIAEKCFEAKIVSVEPLRGKSLHGVGIAVDDAFWFTKGEEECRALLREVSNAAEVIACFELRRCFDIFPDDRIVIDVKTILEDHKKISAAASKLLAEDPVSDRLSELEHLAGAHVASARIVGMDSSNLSKLVTPEFLSEYIEHKARAVLKLYHVASKTHRRKLEEFRDSYSLIRTLRQIELNGICVDVDYAQAQLKLEQKPMDASMLRSVVSLEKSGFVTSLVNTAGSKTDRLRHEGGFNSMGIPHGPARSAIVSRHEGGEIFSFDFNAIDYRCIVEHIGGRLAQLYKDAQDFHEKTREIVGGQHTRKNVKYISYVHIYGGTVDSLQSKTLLPRKEIERLLAEFDRTAPEIKELRDRLWHEYQRDGWIEFPTGLRVELGEATHAGQLIGLFAQNFSSHVFKKSLIRTHELCRSSKSQVIFTVHDEINVDMHPDDVRDGLPEKLKREMESAIEGKTFVVKIGRGRTYGDAAP